MSKTAVFFGPRGGSVNKVAELVANALGSHVDLVAVESASADTLLKYDNLILGVSTVGRANWDSSHSDSGWDAFLAHLTNVDIAGKHVAIFGLGDAVTYPENFVDAIGFLHDRFKAMGAVLDGYCSQAGYRFTGSDAVKNNVFVGLPIDEDNEPDLTQQRVNAWVNGLKQLGY